MCSEPKKENLGTDENLRFMAIMTNASPSCNLLGHKANDDYLVQVNIGSVHVDTYRWSSGLILGLCTCHELGKVRGLPLNPNKS